MFRFNFRFSWVAILHSNINSLAPGIFEWNFRLVIFKQILVIVDWDICCEIALIWMLLDFTDDQSTLVQVMVWCRQAWANVGPDLCRHMASLGHNELRWSLLQVSQVWQGVSFQLFYVMGFSSISMKMYKAHLFTTYLILLSIRV